MTLEDLPPGGASQSRAENDGQRLLAGPCPGGCCGGHGNTGTQAAKEAGNLVDLDSNPTKLIEIVEIGKQLLMTRGALTTFSIANDIAKYFAIIPVRGQAQRVAGGAGDDILVSVGSCASGR